MRVASTLMLLLLLAGCARPPDPHDESRAPSLPSPLPLVSLAYDAMFATWSKQACDPAPDARPAHNVQTGARFLDPPEAQLARLNGIIGDGPMTRGTEEGIWQTASGVYRILPVGPAWMLTYEGSEEWLPARVFDIRAQIVFAWEFPEGTNTTDEPWPDGHGAYAGVHQAGVLETYRTFVLSRAGRGTDPPSEIQVWPAVTIESGKRIAPSAARAIAEATAACLTGHPVALEEGFTRAAVNESTGYVFGLARGAEPTGMPGCSYEFITVDDSTGAVLRVTGRQWDAPYRPAC